MARPKKQNLDRFIELLREMDSDDIAAIPAIVKGFLAGRQRQAVSADREQESIFAELGERNAAVGEGL